MKSNTAIALIILISIYTDSRSQNALTASIERTQIGSSVSVSEPIKQKEHVVRMTGVRFSYPLVQYWIDKYSKVSPDIQIIIEWRGSQDPSQYDILVEAYPHPDEIKKQREYVNIARYAILPVANNKSDFAKTYSVKGLTKEIINQVFFYDIYAENEQKINAPFTTYIRLQKAGAPIVFARYFGHEQKDIKGKGIAGSDEHLLKAVLRDSTGVSYLPLTSIYEKSTKKPISGLSVLPVDLNGNDRVSDDERFYDDLSNVIQHLANSNTKDINNIPIEYVHFSVDRKNASPHAIAFIRWVIDNGLSDLGDFGYLQPEASQLQKDKFEEFASRQPEGGKR